MLRPSPAASCSSRLPARPSSIATVAASSASPTARPYEAGGDEIVAVDGQAAVANVVEPAPRSRKGRVAVEGSRHGHGLRRLVAQRRPETDVGDRSVVDQHVGQVAGAGGGVRDDIALSGRERELVESRGELATVAPQARRERGEIGAGVSRAEGERALDDVGLHAKAARCAPGQRSDHRRPEAVALQLQQRRGLRLAQQQAQLGAQA